MKDSMDKQWGEILDELNRTFEEKPDIKSILFLIGVQELGGMHKSYSKKEKLDVMHVAVCKLLSNYGYYQFVGTDADGWPHWESREKLPDLSPDNQEELIKEAIIRYFKNKGTAV